MPMTDRNAFGSCSYSHSQPTPVRSFPHDIGNGARGICENGSLAASGTDAGVGRKAPKRRARHDLPGPAGAWLRRTRPKRHAPPTPASVPSTIETNDFGTGSLPKEDLATASPVRSGSAAPAPSAERGDGEEGDRNGSAGATSTGGGGAGGDGEGRGRGGGQLFHDHSGSLHDCNAWNLMCATIGRIAPRPDTTPLPQENPARSYRRMLRRSVPGEYALIHEVRAGRYDTFCAGPGGHCEGDLKVPLLAGYVASVQCHAHSDWSALLVDETHGVVAGGGGCDRRKGRGGKNPIRGIMCCLDERLVKNHANWVRPGTVWLLQGARLALFSEIADGTSDYDSDIDDETDLPAHSSSVPSPGMDVSPSRETVRGGDRIDRMLMVAESNVVYAWTPEDAASSFTDEEYLNLNQRRSDLTFPVDVDEVGNLDGTEAKPPSCSPLAVPSQTQPVLADVISSDALIEAPGQSPKKVTPQNTTSKNQLVVRREATEKRIVSVEKPVHSDHGNAINEPMPPRNRATDESQNDLSTGPHSLSYSNDKHSNHDDAFRSCQPKAGEEITSRSAGIMESVPGRNKDDLRLLESTGNKSSSNGRTFTSNWFVGQGKENSPHSNPNRQSETRHQTIATLENEKKTTPEKAELLRAPNKGPRQRLDASKMKVCDVLDKHDGLEKSAGSKQCQSSQKASPTGVETRDILASSKVIRSNPYARDKPSERATKSVANELRSDDLSIRAKPPTDQSCSGKTAASCTGAADGSIPETPAFQLDVKKEETNTVIQNAPQIQSKGCIHGSLDTKNEIAAQTMATDKVTHFSPKNDISPQQLIGFGTGDSFDDMLGEEEYGFDTTQQIMKQTNGKEISVETTISQKVIHFARKENTPHQTTIGTGDSFDDMLDEDDGFGTTINTEHNMKEINTVQSKDTFGGNLLDKEREIAEETAASEKVTHFSPKGTTLPQQQAELSTGNSFHDMHYGEDKDGFGTAKNMQQNSCPRSGEKSFITMSTSYEKSNNSPMAGSKPNSLADNSIMAPPTTREPCLFDSMDADGVDLLGEDD